MDIFGSFAAALIGALVWTLIVRHSPVILTKVITKRIEHVYNKSITELKGEIEKENTAMQSSLAFLAASQSELRTKTNNAVETLWIVIRNQQEEFGQVLTFMQILDPKQLDDAFRGVGKLRSLLSKYEDIVSLSNAIQRTERHLDGWEIIYVSARLWLIYETLFRTHNRMAGLVQKSMKERKYFDWRNDELLLREIKVVLAEEKVNSLIGSSNPTPLINSLKAEFIEEARKLVRGSGEWESVDDIYQRLMSLPPRNGYDT